MEKGERKKEKEPSSDLIQIPFRRDPLKSLKKEKKKEKKKSKKKKKGLGMLKERRDKRGKNRKKESKPKGRRSWELHNHSNRQYLYDDIPEKRRDKEREERKGKGKARKEKKERKEKEKKERIRKRKKGKENKREKEKKNLENFHFFLDRFRFLLRKVDTFNGKFSSCGLHHCLVNSPIGSEKKGFILVTIIIR